jgi:hypothetical protein
MNDTQTRAMRQAAADLHPEAGPRVAIVEGGRVRALDLPQDQAEDWRDGFFPCADVVPMSGLAADVRQRQSRQAYEAAAWARRAIREDRTTWARKCRRRPQRSLALFRLSKSASA